MSKIRKLSKNFRKLTRAVAGIGKRYPALLGDPDGNIPSDDSRVFITLRNGVKLEAANAKVPNQRMKVIVGYDDINPERLQVLGERWQYHKPLAGSLPLHWEDTHGEFKKDMAFITGNQYVPLLATLGKESFSVHVFGAVMLATDNTEYVVIDNVLDLDLSTYAPVNGAKYVVLQVTPEGTITVVDGDPVDYIEYLDAADIPLPDYGCLPIWAIKLYSGQDRLHKDSQWNDFVDLRSGVGGNVGIANGVMLKSVYDINTNGIVDNTEAIGSAAVETPLNPASRETIRWDGSKFVAHAMVAPWLKNAPPSVDDDTTTGYSKGDIWINQAADAAYVCVDDADGAAIWLQYQTQDATLTSLSALGTAADKIAYTTGVDTWAETAITAAGRALLDDADAGTMRTTLGLAGGTTGQFWRGDGAWSNTLIQAASNPAEIMVLNTAPDTRVFVVQNTGGTELLRFGVRVTSGVAYNDSVFIGNLTGQYASGYNNLLIGDRAGRGVRGGGYNVVIGGEALASNSGTDGNARNFALGYASLNALTDGIGDVAIGFYTLGQITTGDYNVAIGSSAGASLQTSSANNVLIGVDAGNLSATVSNSVVIGPNAGRTGLVSNRLYIANSNTALPLIYGEFDNGLLQINGLTTTTNAVKEAHRILAYVSTVSTGASAGFGPAQTFYGESSADGTYRQMGQLDYTWATATDASRKARGTLWVYDTAAREAIRAEASGSEAMLGFYGVAATARQLLATGAGATVDDVITALQTLGLVKQS